MGPMTDRPMGAFAPAAWVHARGVLSLERPRIMAVVNLTPDSFHDGGMLMAEDGRVDVQAVLERCRRAAHEGADILDLGAESTRPGSSGVDPELQCERLLPVLEALELDGSSVPVSIDTQSAEVAARTLAAGAAMINDVSGLGDPAMAEVVAEQDAGLVIGHLRGKPETMQQHVRFVDLLAEVTDELAQRVERAVDAGVERPRIVVDPGIGFGKSAEQSAALVAASGWLRQATRCPVLIGASRKSFLGALTGRSHQRRMVGSLAAAMVAVEQGASILRVHDVAETAEALGVAASIREAFRAHARGRDTPVQ